MGRPEQPVDPDAGPVERLAWELRQLREDAGRPSYRRLARRAGFAASTLAAAAKGTRLSSLEVVVTYAVACGGDQEEWEQRWRAAAAAVKEAGQSPNGELGRCPYPGLAALSAADADLFFGRSGVVERLWAEMGKAALVAVFGASGSGKSSVLRAGLMPALDRAGIRAVLMTPGAHPLDELARALDGSPDPIATRRQLREDPAALATTAAVLVIDQFEEAFTLCSDEAERSAFLDALATLCGAPEGQLTMVLGVRADFYGHCAEHAALASALDDGVQLPLGPMPKSELRSIITGPAARTGLTVDPDLVEAVLDDVAGQPGALPLVAHALRETWQRRDGDTLRLAGYQATGGMLGAVAQTAERLYGDLGESDRDLVRTIFLRLTRLGEGTEDTRRRINRGELSGVAAAEDIDDILGRLAAARLIVMDRETAEVAHEALIRAWPRLRQWLSDDRDAVRDQRRLTEAAMDWDARDRGEDYLFRGARLAAWEGRGASGLSGIEQAFLSSSRERESREHAARRRRVRMSVGGLAAALAVMSVLAAVALVNARDADRARDLAFSRLLTGSARNEMERDPELALLLARQAYQEAPNVEAATVLRNALAVSRVRATVRVGQGRVLGVALSPDGRRMATTGADGTTKIWDRKGWGVAGQPTAVSRGNQSGGLSPVFSPDGRYLASSGAPGTVRVWDLRRGAEPAVLYGLTAPVERLAFSPDGRYLAASGRNGSLLILDRQGAPPRTIRRGSLSGSEAPVAAFSPDGRLLATYAGDKIRVRDLRKGRVVRTLAPAAGTRTLSLVFSPDGRQLSATGTGGGVEVWTLTGSLRKKRYPSSVSASVAAFNADGGRQASAGQNGVVSVWIGGERTFSLRLSGHSGAVLGLAFSPDAHALASAGEDGTVRIWDIRLAANPTVFAGHERSSGTLAFSRDGSRLASNGPSGGVRVWDTARGGDSPLVLSGASYPSRILTPRTDARALALSPDGRRVASEGTDGKVRVWTVGPGAKARTLRQTIGLKQKLAFSPDGRRLAFRADRTTVALWPLDNGSPAYVETGQGEVSDVAFTPDGRLATAGSDGTVRLWTKPSDDGKIIARGHEQGIGAITFSPDGRKLATYGRGSDTIVRIWNVRDGGDPVVLRGARPRIVAIASSGFFSPDGRWLVEAESTDTIEIRDPADDDGEPIRLTPPGGEANFVAFSPDGRLATAHKDGRVRLWPCEMCQPMDKLQKLAAQRSTRDLTPAERRRFLGSGT